jgi:hypothetical protein
MKTCAAFLVVAVLTLPALGAEKPVPISAKQAFEKMKSLAGEWTGKAGAPGEQFDVTIQYRVTAAGSAVIETMFPGTEHEMITMYHMDGGKLLLTHYCAQGNQPRMALTKKSTGNLLDFSFDGGTNMKSKKDSHMHAARILVADANTVSSEWDHFESGKKTSTMKFELKRK